MVDLDELESKSIYILREAFHSFEKLGLLWSLGKDSNVMIWLARKAFFGHSHRKPPGISLATDGSGNRENCVLEPLVCRRPLGSN